MADAMTAAATPGAGVWHALCPSGNWSTLDPGNDDIHGSCLLIWVVLTAIPAATAAFIWALYHVQYRHRSSTAYTPVAADPLIDADSDYAAELATSEVAPGAGLYAPGTVLDIVRDVNAARARSFTRRAVVAVAAAYAVSLVLGAVLAAPVAHAVTWQAVHAAFAALLVVAAVRVPSTRIGAVAAVAAVDAVCMVLYLRAAIFGGHAVVETVQVLLAVTSCTLAVIEYNRATRAAQSAILAASPTSAADQPAPSLEPVATVWQHLTYSWFTPLVYAGFQRPLELGDLWDLVLDDKSSAAIREYHAHARPGRSAIVAAMTALRVPMITQILLSLVYALMTFCGPFFLNRLLAFLERGDRESGEMEPWMLVGGMFVTATATSFVQGRMFFLGRRVGTRLRAILTSLLYRKTLTRNQYAARADGDDESKKKKQDINVLIGPDLGRVVEFICQLPFLIVTPLQIVLAIAGLYYVLGWPALTGVALLVVTMPLQSWSGKLVEARQQTLMGSTDARVKKTQEVLQGIRIIKYFAWERPFAATLTALRDKEMREMRHYWVTMVAVQVMYQIVPTLVSLLTFVTYTKAAGHALDATTVFTCVSLFNALRMPLFDLPDRIIRLFETKVSVQRIQAYLDDVDVVDYTVDSTRTSGPYIGAVRATLSWPAGSVTASTALKDVTLSIPRGKLTVILGPTGAGKTMLLHALLGELALDSGRVCMPHTPIAYVPQQPWLLNATVQENILFGTPATDQRDRYQRILAACALVRDLAVLEAGDQTQIGERGIALSGGQKARVSLARACFMDADVVLLDDVLAAVDAPTAAHLFVECLLGELRGRTRVLVSHNVALVASRADHIVYVKEGRVVAEADSVEDACAQLVAAGLEAEAKMLAETATPDSYGAPAKGKGKARALTTSIDADADGEGDEEDGKPLAKAHQLVSTEEQAKGTVEWAVYKTYIAASGGVLWWTALLGSLFVPQLLLVVQDWWLKTWAEAYTQTSVYMHFAVVPMGAFKAAASNEADTQPDVDVNYYLLVYLGLGLINIALAFAANMIEMSRSLAAGRILHADLLTRILGAPISWFDSTPIGRVLNRMSKDIQTVDREVIFYLTGTSWAGVSVLIVIGVVTVIAPTFIIFVLPVVLMYRSVSQLYLATSRELKRIESTTRSPIYSCFEETAAGTSVIRAFHKHAQFMTRVHKTVDTYHRAYFYLWTSNRWLGTRIDFCANISVLMCGILILMAGNSMSAGTAGLALSWAMPIADVCRLYVRLYALAEMGMNSVERVLEYTQIEQEAQGGAAPATTQWPMHGAVTVRDLVLHYPSSTTPVLHGVSFALNPREKCGVVGRTGAGKSSLALALLRMIEPLSGTVEIDGVRASDLDLEVLRSRVTMVPQDVVLFEGTVRSNLDVLGEFDDAACWSALARVHFFESTVQAVDAVDAAAAADDHGSFATTTATTWTLDSKIDAGGKNLSVGQRQLLALARALVRRSKVIIFDESTANVSNDLDAKIQHTIREEFVDSTVLCIAHRLRTIADFDKVLVMDHGRVVEFGAPADLLRNPEGMFFHMCRESGEFEHLAALAAARSTRGAVGDAVLPAGV
ncbi:hypothetical protein AMAG_07693 [Allomyces macrogynus ATCC 38327]|uniref:Uncharacterized protein n=1 Tax=Allomyces macrogynus (strain ATCC 38327) TaxID=578462 RepID=A0A0L0SJ30_ALLM3|nr:hypothetical protein AMAG_07693 [Allomyces macrogynus ATCC 38327]|eukprot:KNE62477.1 hypothetical protein AMAG_07693 [Allomyces macrogynus ATCC 38327]